MTTTSPAPVTTDPPADARGSAFSKAIERVCSLGGIVFSIFFGIGFALLAGFVPVLDPSDSAQEIAAIFREDQDRIRAGLVICYVGCMFFLLFGSGIHGQTRRIKGAPKTIGFLQLSSYAAAVILIIYPLTTWMAIAYRPDEWDPQLIQIFNDFAWISFLIGFVPFVTWVVSTGIAILCDQSANPLFPRWVGYVSVFQGFVQMTAVLLLFFKDGPFAYDGLFSWWIPATDFFSWFMLITVFTMKAINRDDYERTA